MAKIKVQNTEISVVSFNDEMLYYITFNRTEFDTIKNMAGINSKDLLIGLDHVMKICAKIDDLMTDKTKPTGLTKSGTRWESSVQK